VSVIFLNEPPFFAPDGTVWANQTCWLEANPIWSECGLGRLREQVRGRVADAGADLEGAPLAAEPEESQGVGG